MLCVRCDTWRYELRTLVCSRAASVHGTSAQQWFSGGAVDYFQLFQVINSNPDWTFHAKEWIIRRMIFSLVGAPQPGMDEEAVQKLLPSKRDWRPTDVYQNQTDLVKKLQRDEWIEDIQEGSTAAAFKPGAERSGE